MSENEVKTPESSETKSFSEELCELINKHSLDSKLNMADYQLAGYIMQTIQLIEQINKNKAYFSGLLGSQFLGGLDGRK